MLWGLLLMLTVSPAKTSSEAALHVAGLHWRLIGPFRGGRALAVTGVPGQPETYYFGSVGGGVWKSDNAGRTWNSIFDNEPVASIGAIAVAPSNSKTLYVGSGEADMRSDIQQGDGMYKSVDSGKTWTHIGLEDTRQIGKIVVEPGDEDTVYVAALGHQYGPNQERGVFKSTDGGQTWRPVLQRGPDVGAIDLAMDPTYSSTLFAAMWHTRRPPWSIYPPSNGPGGGLFKTTDSGETWTQVKGHGFPENTARIGIAISPADHQRIYAFVDSPDPKVGGIYRSDDGGTNWEHTDGEPRVWGRGWYFAGITADPKNADEVYVMNTSSYRSTDGGRHFTPFKGAPGGDDYHSLWIQPDDPSHMILGSDQGVVVSVDDGKSWSSWYNQPIAQLYHVVTDRRVPYWVYGAQQDSGGIAVLSRSIHTGISSMDARPIDAGGESGTIAPDPRHPGVLMSSTGGRETLSTAASTDVEATRNFPGTAWRNTWTLPIVASPTQAGVFYTSHQQIFRTADDGKTWKIISPDLSRPSNVDPPNLDAVTAADTDGARRRGVVYWIAPSPVKVGEIWAGTDDGLVWLTTDEGVHWANVTPPQLTPWSKVGIVDASAFDANTATIAVDRHRLDDNRPYIYRTHDRGRHWKLIVNGLPRNQFVNVVREDPKRPGLLYSGTDRGIFTSTDDGANWRSLQLNLPAASVRDIVFGGNDVVVGTHGRSIWILDDPTPLRQPVPATPMHLYRPSPTVVFQRAGEWGYGLNDEGTPLPPEEPQGENAPWGALIDYSLGRPSKVVLRVYGASGRLVREISSDDRQRPVNLNTLEIPAYWVKPTPRLDGRPGDHRYLWNLRYRADDGPILAPGRYRVTLTAGGRTESQPLVILRDPRLDFSDAALQKRFAMALAVSDEADRVASAMTKATQRAERASPAVRREILALVGSGRRARRRGPISGARDSLTFVSGSLQRLRGSLSGAGGAPTAEDRKRFSSLKATAEEDLRALDKMR